MTKKKTSNQVAMPDLGSLPNQRTMEGMMAQLSGALDEAQGLMYPAFDTPDVGEQISLAEKGAGDLTGLRRCLCVARRKCSVQSR